VTCSWSEFTTALSRELSDILFWSKPEDFVRFGRGEKGIAMCNDNDLTSMLELAGAQNWEYVAVYDATDQFPDDPDDNQGD
jgi:hypothetical protein